MNQGERIFLATVIVLVDMLIFALPLTALFVCYVLMARPVWFRKWVEDLYGN